MQPTGDQNFIKRMNKAIVLQTLRRKSPLSRAHISELTGLNKATVSSLVGELIEEKLAEEIGLGESSGGRKPILLLFNRLAGYSVGVDLGVNYLLSVLADLQGNVIAHRHTPHRNESFEQVMTLLFAEIRQLMQKAPASPYHVVGIGVGVSGLVDLEGRLLFAPNLGWRDVPLKEKLEQEFQLPVQVENEAHAGALGEKLYGAGAGGRQLVYISAGMGIGTGIIINNELYRGSGGLSGEMGHMVIEAGGKLCRCGNRGCWELYASEKTLLEEYCRRVTNAEDSATQAEPTVEQIVAEAEGGSPAARQSLGEIGEYLGIGISNIINTFNPETILIGNRLSLAGDWILEPIRRVTGLRSLPYHRRKLRIELATLGIFSCARGAASLPAAHFLEHGQKR